MKIAGANISTRLTQTEPNKSRGVKFSPQEFIANDGPKFQDFYAEFSAKIPMEIAMTKHGFAETVRFCRENDCFMSWNRSVLKESFNPSQRLRFMGNPP